MNPDQRAENWRAARKGLQRARALLPSNPTRADAQGREVGSLAQYEEFLAHSELELALGELESLGELNEVPCEYWQHPLEVALQLDLAERATYYATKLDPT